MKHRATHEVIVGGVFGPIDRPEVVIAGRYRGSDLVMVGRSVPLNARQSAELGAVLRPARRGHPWPDEITSYRWGGKDSIKPLTKVQPRTVIEVAADASGATDSATSALCPDLRPEELQIVDIES
ncbi:hypothetical protein EV643_1673 [Kribbella sp. VKM Ac-2527]|uniref:Uncharacterized protein n=1 Tax=Kribbella caucasensis TaxID=2512215 RepID=A0A4R6IV65_9ACTN|nr:hypothetical protein [Kribbella sp. VKM Ac-2527]TDO26237.1 hypothetical protein EV643_1673 [Kribbella sp. VKM Ac-2527]